MSTAAQATPEQAGGAPLLEADGVSIQFGGLKALTDFHLAIRKGDLQGLDRPQRRRARRRPSTC